MKANITEKGLLIAVLSTLLVISVPQKSIAQRFHHGGAGRFSRANFHPGGGMNRPGANGGGVQHQPPHPSPQPNPQPHPGPPPGPVPGPHPGPPPPPPPPHPYYPYRPVPIVPMPYVYHPFVPFYWGAYWHPVGFFVAALTTAAIVITIENEQYHYDQGVYYVESSGGYKVVPAPIGAIVSSLPEGNTTVIVGDDTFYYFGGAYYVKVTANSYKVVSPPEGATVTQLPEGSKETEVNGVKYMVYNNTYYQPVSQDGKDAYEVIVIKN